MSEPRLNVLYEDNHLLVVDKPVGLITQGASAEQPSLIARAKAYLKQKYHKPGNVFLGVVSRLDAATSGVVVLARTSKAAARLTEQFQTRNVEKLYWALVSGQPPDEAECVDWLWHDDAAQQVVIAQPKIRGAQESRLQLRCLRRLGQIALLEIELFTGRKHQIRVQLAARGWPVLGDRKYGSRVAFAEGIGLHARSLTLEHPTRGERLTFVADTPDVWSDYLVDPRPKGAS